MHNAKYLIPAQPWMKDPWWSRVFNSWTSDSSVPHRIVTAETSPNILRVHPYRSIIKHRSWTSGDGESRTERRTQCCICERLFLCVCVCVCVCLSLSRSLSLTHTLSLSLSSRSSISLPLSPSHHSLSFVHIAHIPPLSYLSLSLSHPSSLSSGVCGLSLSLLILLSSLSLSGCV